MLDNLRNQASFQEEEPNDPKTSQDSKERKPRRSLDQVTHMTPQQRFALALMLLIIVVLLGVMLLFISGKVVPPFMS
jgi:1,4-dihydroxy-2-naphthoate octaprenyltransferase